MSNDEVEADKMRNALNAIANEMQRLQNDSTKSSTHCGKCENEEILHKLIKCKTSLNLRKIEVKKLRQSVKRAFSVARSMSSAKATETATLKRQLELAKTQYLDLVEHEREQNQIINNLNIENNSLRDQLKHFNDIVQMGYKELQKIGNEHVENIPILEQLKQIIVSCGQFYADHCNEQERCTRLEQKNRFLCHKKRIIESNLEAALDELRCLRTYKKPSKESKEIVAKSQQCFGVVCSEYKIGSYNKKYITMTKTEYNHNSVPSNILDNNLTTHLNNVKNLLKDQDDLINDLNSLSKILNNDYF